MTETTQERWHGIARKEVPWFPTVAPDACIGCGLCFVTCGRGVYDLEGRKAEAARPYACMVGCSTCATVCPTGAIHFPEKAVVQRIEREHKIFKLVQEEARTKKGKQDAAKARAAAEEAVAGLHVRSRLEIAGAFGDRQFLVQLQRLLKDQAIDIVNLRLDVPTVKGTREKAPSFMSFELTSTDQGEITAFLPRLRDLIRTNGFVLVQEVRL